MVGRRLNDIELDSYDVAPAELGRRVTVVRIPFLPGGYKGLTLLRWVFLADEVVADGDSALLAHEMVHVRQWHDLGFLGFAVPYLRDFATNLWRYRSWNQAYHQIELELEAKRETTDWLRRRTRDRAIESLDDQQDEPDGG